METETKNLIVPTGNSIFAFTKSDEESDFLNVAKIIPDIVDVEVITNKDTDIVIVYFSDDTKEKAILAKGDTYDFEQGISICLTKKLLSDMTNGNGSSVYNKLIKHCVRTYNENRMYEQKVKEEEEALERKIAKERERKARKRERRIERERKEYIEVLTKCIKSAISEILDERKGDNE